jgi:hypothetical protein
VAADMAKKSLTKDTVILYHQESNSVTMHGVIDTGANMLETDVGILPIEGSRAIPNVNKGGMLYLYQVDLPALIEAENLKQLRRSVAIRNMFQFGKDGMDLKSLIPWIICLALIIFK